MSDWANRCLRDLAEDPEFVGAKVMIELGELIYLLQQRDSELAALRAELAAANDLIGTLRGELRYAQQERDAALADAELGRLVRKMPVGWVLTRETQEIWGTYQPTHSPDGVLCYELFSNPENALREAMGENIAQDAATGGDNADGTKEEI
jgi:hypothetical protein